MFFFPAFRTTNLISPSGLGEEVIEIRIYPLLLLPSIIWFSFNNIIIMRWNLEKSDHVCLIAVRFTVTQ